jgi:hypothetical protein
MFGQETSGGHRVRGTSIAAVIIVIAVLTCWTAEAAPVAVRLPERAVHAHLLLRSLSGETIGEGDVTQVVKARDVVESHLVLRFKDGSLHDEKVVFSQQRVFKMIRYRLIQRGPSFPEQIEVSIERGSAEYKVRSQAGKGKEEVLTGRFDVPNDTYNGMLVVLLKNLPEGANEPVNVLAFTPAPQVIKLQLLFIGEQTVGVGDLSTKARRYVLKPQIGQLQELFAKLSGRLPADFHIECSMLADKVPSFVEMEGPLQLMGPTVRIELVSPRPSSTPKDKKTAAD